MTLLGYSDRHLTSNIKDEHGIIIATFFIFATFLTLNFQYKTLFHVLETALFKLLLFVGIVLNICKLLNLPFLIRQFS